MFIAVIAFALVLANLVGAMHFSSGTMAVIIIVGAIGLIIGGFSEAGKDEAARRNARDYWMKRGSGVRDRRYDDRRRRR